MPSKLHRIYKMHTIKVINPFSASCSKLLLFEGFSAILVQPTIFNF